MKDYEFYRKYANMPLLQRDKPIVRRFNESINSITLTQIYKRVSDIDDKIRSDLIEKEMLLSIAEESFTQLTRE